MRGLFFAVLTALFLGSCEEASKMDIQRYIDGNGNTYRLKGKDPVVLSYVAITPAMSSSGLYSGGKNREIPLSGEALKKLSELGTAALSNGVPSAPGGRPLGTGLIEYTDGSNRASVVLPMNDPAKLELEKYLRSLVR